MSDEEYVALKRSLAGTATLDDVLWPLISRKVSVLGRALDGVRGQKLAAEAATLADAPARLAEQRAAAEAEQTSLREKVAAAETRERAAEAALREAEAALNAIRERVAAARETRAGAAARSENAELRRVEMGRLSGERFECPPPVLPEKLGFTSADIRIAQTEQADHDRFVAERERIGPVNLVAAQELEELEASQATSRAESAELTTAINQLRGSIGSLNREGRQRLLAAFEAVDAHFRRLFTTLFNGGQAHLELIDSDDPLESGLEIMAQPPGKKLAALTLLSGGEQASGPAPPDRALTAPATTRSITTTHS